MNIMAADLKKTLRNKLLILLSACAVIALAVAVVSHYFYILDAYYYTSEFHVLFMVNNIGAANVDLLKEYFSSIRSPVAAFPPLVLAHLVQSFLLPFSKPILTGVAEDALGVATGIGMSFAAILLVGVLSYGLARFFLGDIVPLVQMIRRREESEPPRYAGLLLGMGLAVPWAPMVPITALMALFRLPAGRSVWLVSAGLGLRMLLSIAFTGRMT